ALGWDLRLANVTGGISLRVRRDDLPDFGAPQQSPYETIWSSGRQMTADSDWVGWNEPDGASVYGHILTVTRGNPLTNGTYRVGVYHGSDAFNASYTLTSRGIGGGYSIPV